MINKINKFLITILLLISAITNVDAQQLTADSKVSLLTCAPGTEIYSVYGHNALRISDPNLKIDYVYNYGTFDFNEPNFMFKFLRGKLLYQLARTNFNLFMREYVYLKRGVKESVFNLTLEEKQSLFHNLELNLKPENKYYLYDFFYDNCATRIVNMVENIDGVTIAYAPKKEELTLRQMLDKYTGHDQWLTFGQSLIVGANADINADIIQQMFIPDYMEAYFNTATNKETNLPLISSTKVLTKFDKGNSNTVLKPVYFFILFLVLEIYLLLKNQNFRWIRIYDKIIYIIMAIASIVVVGMWFLTDHGATKYNWNLLWINPMFIGLVLWQNKPKIKYVAIVLITCLITSLFYKFLPQDYYHSSFILIVALIINQARLLRRNEITLSSVFKKS